MMFPREFNCFTESKPSLTKTHEEVNSVTLIFIFLPVFGPPESSINWILSN